MAGVGGSSIHEQMRALDAERVEELVRVYREHNEPLHEGLELFVGMEELLAELHEQGAQARHRYREAPRRPCSEPSTRSGSSGSSTRS